MEEQNNGNAAENGEQVTKEQQEQHQKPEPANVPYVRFQEVIEARKAAETALNSVIDSMVQELPEDMRDIVPDLPPAEKAQWIRAAKAKGIFTPPAAIQNSPDSKRPAGKPITDISTLSPLQKIRAGYANS